MGDHLVKLLSLGVAVSILSLARADAKDWKTVVIGMEGDYAPYNLTGPDGKIVGFEVDLVNDLCARMKVECKIIPQDWDGMIAGLQAGKFDVIADGMSITDERKQTIDFTNAYANVPAALMAPKTSPLAQLPENGKALNLTKDPAAGDAAIQHLKDTFKGKTIGVQVSTIHANFADKYLKGIATVKEYKTVDERDLDLVAGRVDAVLDDITALQTTLAKPEGKDLALVGPQMTGGVFGSGVGFGLRKSDADLTARFNEALKAAAADGSVKKYSMAWFKMDTAP